MDTAKPGWIIPKIPQTADAGQPWFVYMMASHPEHCRDPDGYLGAASEAEAVFIIVS